MLFRYFRFSGARRQVLQREGLPTACREDAAAVCRAAMQFATGEHGLLEVVGELDGVKRTCRHAQLAECAAAKVVEILVEFALLLSVGQLDRLGRLITRLSYTIATFVIIGRTVMYFINMEFDWIGFITYFLQTIMVAVALVAVAIPEGLPMAVTLSLAYSMKRMLKTNNLVRKMHACETMGAVTVICTDKTGTLTQNKMQVVEANFFGTYNNDPIVAEGIAVNSTAQLDLSNPSNPAALGNPTEGALLMWLYSQGIDYQSIRLNSDVVEELPFTTENKYMATIVRTGANTRRIYVKGAPEIITGMVQELPQGTTIGHINNLLEGYQNKAMRTLAFAYADLQETSTPIVDGIVAIGDPIRPDVPDAIGDCIKAGIRVTIVTGDTVATARQIAREIGLWTDDDDEHSITTGPELSAMTDEELRQCAQRLKIVARARPMDKKRHRRRNK